MRVGWVLTTLVALTSARRQLDEQFLKTLSHGLNDSYLRLEHDTLRTLCFTIIGNDQITQDEKLVMITWLLYAQTLDQMKSLRSELYKIWEGLEAEYKGETAETTEIQIPRTG